MLKNELLKSFFSPNFPLDVFRINKHDKFKLPDGVMVAQKILALFVEVRILVGQPCFVSKLIKILRNI